MAQESKEIREEIERTRYNMGGTLDEIENRVVPGRVVQRQKAKMASRVTDLRDRVMGVGHELTDRVSTTAGNVSSSASSAGDSASGAVRQAPQVAKQQTQGHPLLAGAVAAGIGFLASVAFPGSKAEGKAAQRVQQELEPLKVDLTNAAKEIAGNMKEQGQQSAQQLSESARQSGEELKQSARESVAQTKETGQEAAQNVKSEIKEAKNEVQSSASS
jgi:gas vesicle protein